MLSFGIFISILRLIRNEFNNNNNIEYLRANDKCSLWYWTGQEGSCYIAVAIEERLHVP